MSCFVFDHQTAQDLREISPGTLFRFESTIDPFSSALQRPQCVLLVPALENGRAVVLEVKRNAETKNLAKAPQSTEPQNRSPQIRSNDDHEKREERRGEESREPRGILGLDGDAVYLDEEELDQRSWWQRLFRS
jgi:hypothetical protein